MEWLDQHKNKDRILFLQREREKIAYQFDNGTLERESASAIVTAITEKIKEIYCNST